MDNIVRYKIVNPLDDPEYRYRLSGYEFWDKYWDGTCVVSSKVITGVTNTSGLPVNAPQQHVEVRPIV